MFTDGNKRTAVMALEVIAKKMGLKIVNNSELFNIANKVATGVVSSVEDIATLIIKK